MKKIVLALALLLSQGAFASGAICSDLFSKISYQELFSKRFKDTAPVKMDVEQAQSPSAKETALLKKYKSQGAEGFHGRIKTTIVADFVSYEQAQLSVREYNTKISTGDKYHLEAYSNGKGTVATYQYGIVLTKLPKPFSSRVQARHQDLLKNGIYTVVGYELGINPIAMAITRTGKNFVQGEASGIIFSRPLAFTKLILNHEIQHVYDMILKPNQFLNEIPAISQKVAEIAMKQFKGETLSPRDQRKANSLMVLPVAFAEAKASEQSLRTYLSLHGFKEIILSRNVLKETVMASIELSNLTIRNLQLIYHQMWVDPVNPKNMIYIFKSALGGYLAIKVSQVPGYAIGYTLLYFM